MTIYMRKRGGICMHRTHAWKEMDTLTQAAMFLEAKIFPFSPYLLDR